MHARIRRRVLPTTICTRLGVTEKERLEAAARNQGLTLSDHVRKVLVESLEVSADGRLILAEVCAMRRETEMLLQAISDLNEHDIDRARNEADGLRRVLVDQRIFELKQQAEGDENHG